MRLTKVLTFEAAHVLPKHPGKCSRLHGHTYRLECTVRGAVDPNTGFVCDFGDLSAVLRNEVFNVLDHQFINDVFVQYGWPGETTAENILYFVWSRVAVIIAEDLEVELIELKLWETATGCAILTADEYDLVRDTPIETDREQEAKEGS